MADTTSTSPSAAATATDVAPDSVQTPDLNASTHLPDTTTATSTISPTDTSEAPSNSQRPLSLQQQQQQQPGSSSLQAEGSGEHADASAPADADEEPDEPYEIVRALYPFESEDKSSLQFDRDALILVYTKLESGWWYGFCNGECGWFPSNFVVQVPPDEMIETEDLAEPQQEDRDDDEGSDNDAGSEDLWLPQTTPDGQVFYFNTRTGESSWTIPTGGSSSDEHSIAETAAGMKKK
ncbi:hypothetical protein BGW41_006584 [Actinomortierella wolfii]|nr:hypothetical protein BGW41_006584 [Actinomortierella wolfii]